MIKVYTSTVELNDELGEYYIPLPEELLESLTWEEGDVVEWRLNKDGSATIERIDEFEESYD